MYLSDIDGVKIDTVTIGPVNVVQAPRRGAKGRSSVAAEDEGHRALAEMVGQANAATTIDPRQTEVGRLGARPAGPWLTLEHLAHMLERQRVAHHLGHLSGRYRRFGTVGTRSALGHDGGYEGLDIFLEGS